MKTKTIRQSVTIKASPHEVYEALMDSRKHSKITGSVARISRQAGGRFSVWDGGLEGVNLELVPDRKIVQSWRTSEWPQGHYSTVTFSFRELGDGRTRLTLRHTGVPEDDYENVKQGWRDFYWKPAKVMLEKGR
ncbi:MAG: SRPBCC domain-containing protein [Chloroflexi bacterium]|nr:SRPBCC domain-containing protein [Chloroflexota bacterium]